LPRDVADPWYTRDFEATWDDVTTGNLNKAMKRNVASFLKAFAFNSMRKKNKT